MLKVARQCHLARLPANDLARFPVLNETSAELLLRTFFSVVCYDLIGHSRTVQGTGASFKF